MVATFQYPEDAPLRVKVIDLHPKMRGPASLLQARLLQAFQCGTIKNRFLMFDGYRAPDEQRVLFLKRPVVTKADAWQSVHNYGLAVDFVPHDPGRGWHWSEDADWGVMRSMAQDRGLMTPIAWDKPHVVHPAWLAIRSHLGLPAAV